MMPLSSSPGARGHASIVEPRTDHNPFVTRTCALQFEALAAATAASALPGRAWWLDGDLALRQVFRDDMARKDLVS
jgi:hypothetical protein